MPDRSVDAADTYIAELEAEARDAARVEGLLRDEIGRLREALRYWCPDHTDTLIYGPAWRPDDE